MKRHFFTTSIVVLLCCQLLVSAANLTNWRNNRRQKRFILFENAGISKLVGGIVYPVDLNDKRPWRQLVMTMNIQYQFPVPPVPIYPWSIFDDERALKKSSTDGIIPRISTDEAQMFLYEFIVELMNRKRMNGLQCLQRAVCENAQVHNHDGLFAEITHRLLTPHRSLDAAYLDAFKMGREGFDCISAFSEAKNCLLDEYLYISKEVFQDEYRFTS